MFHHFTRLLVPLLFVEGSINEVRVLLKLTIGAAAHTEAGVLVCVLKVAEVDEPAIVDLVSV